MDMKSDTFPYMGGRYIIQHCIHTKIISGYNIYRLYRINLYNTNILNNNMKRSIPLKLLLVVFVSMLMVVPMFSVDNGPSVSNSSTYSLPIITNSSTHSDHSISSVTHNIQSIPETGNLITSLINKLRQSPHNFTPVQSSEQSGKLYKVTFSASNLPAGIPWTVSIMNNSIVSSSFEDNGVVDAYSGDLMNISVFQTVNSTINTSISLYLNNGSYCYLAGPANTITNYRTFQVSGRAMSINVSFPSFYRVVISEENIPSNISWNSIVSSKYNLSYNYYNITQSTSMVSYLPNGTYGFISGPQSTYIYEHSFTVHGHNINVTVKFPKMYRVEFSETNLHDNLGWFIQSQNPNYTIISFNLSYGPSMVLYMPEGNYTYNYAYTTFTNESNIDKLNSYFSLEASNDAGSFIVGDRTNTVSIIFPEMYKVTFSETNVPGPVLWGISLYSSQAGMFIYNYPYSSIMIAYLPNGTYDYTPELGGVSYPGGNFTVNGTSSTINVRFSGSYNVTFTATNVPSGVYWNLYLQNQNYTISYTNSTVFASMIAYLPNGTYDYTPELGGRFISWWKFYS